MPADDVLLRGLLRDAAAVDAEGDFNRFDGALCEALDERFLLAEDAAWGRAFEPAVLEPFDVFAATLRFAAALGDFLRDFLDIRLPFVAFGGSIIAVLRVIYGEQDSLPWLGKSDALGVWLQAVRRTACQLVG
jgi:hypothetical protein